MQTLETVLKLDRPDAFDGSYAVADFEQSYARGIQESLRRLIDGLSYTYECVSSASAGEHPRQPLLVVSPRLAEGRELCGLLRPARLPVYVATPWEALQVERRFSGALVRLQLEAFSAADLVDVLFERRLIPWVIFYADDEDELLARASLRAAKYGKVVFSKLTGARRLESAACAVIAELELRHSSR